VGPDLDARRRSDLTAIAEALQAYRETFGKYPFTNGNVQSVCQYERNDVLCLLRPFGLSLIDPTGVERGYWYSSDGNTFSLYASMDRPPERAESCTVEHLKDFKNLLCLKRPP
jgi:hypothetical protein